MKINETAIINYLGTVGQHGARLSTTAAHFGVRSIDALKALNVAESHGAAVHTAGRGYYTDNGFSADREARWFPVSDAHRIPNRMAARVLNMMAG